MRETERQLLGSLLTKGYRAQLQIAYSHERICNEKQYVTKLNSHTDTHTHTHTYTHTHTQETGRYCWHSTFIVLELTIKQMPSIAY